MTARLREVVFYLKRAIAELPLPEVELEVVSAAVRDLERELTTDSPDIHFEGTTVRCGKCGRKVADIDIAYHEHDQECGS